jgi:tetratricopeptide (TPR) repeat protein
MGHQYGRSQAAVLIDAGDYEEAVTAATAAITGEPEYSEHFFERASALANLERYAEAVEDIERARELDAEARVLDDDVVDDAYFSALLGAARAEEVAAGCARLERYRAQFPEGRHVSDASDWQKRLRGQLPSHFVKER